MKKSFLFNTASNEIPAAVARLTLAIILFPHGAQKLLGWFGGDGFTGTMQFFTGTVKLPWIIGFAVIIIEFFSPLFLIAGIATRVWAALIMINMTGIIFFAHSSNGFFMNWSGTQPGEGYEYHLLFIGLALVSLVAGGGKWSFDAHLSKKQGATV